MEEHIRILDYFHLYRDEDPVKGGPYGPYLQSKRLDIYHENAQKLIESGHAYHCFCSEERLDLLRKNAIRMRQIPRYDNKCRTNKPEDVKARLANKEPHVIRLKLDDQVVNFTDTVFGDTQHDYKEGDIVIIKSDGFPIYHFSTVVDDHYMQISHVIRGWEWLSSTAKHLKLFEILNWTPPKWIHLPLITADGRSKLSKRREDAFVDFYTDTKGYLPLAVLNFLVRNHSGIRDFEENKMYLLEELVERFDEKLINRRNFMMDENSLENYGRLAFRQADFKSVLLPLIRDRLKHQLPDTHPDLLQDSYLESVVKFLRLNEETFSSLSQLTRGDFKFFFGRAQSPDKILKKYDKDQVRKILEKVLARQKSPQDKFKIEDLEELHKEFNMSKSKFFALIRMILIDNDTGPPIVELYSFFKPQEIYRRFEDMYNMLS
uniref:Glutamate--tRNA ligase, mitochondrial n=1 Tax=Acrobeloides nanus TaxID=290746 RepID=A0A914CGQ0_9BILA